MSNGINVIHIVGRLGADPDIRPTLSGSLCANMRVCTSESWMDKGTGEKRVKDTWHRVCAFNKPAEIARDWLKKGDTVYFQGKMNYRDWTRDGVKRTSAEIVTEKLERLYGPLAGTNLEETSKEPPEGFDEIPFI